MAIKTFVVLLIGLALASVHLVEAQQTGKIPRIGFIASASPEAVPNIEPLRAGLRELGYVEGKNILVEYRYAEGMEDRLPGLVAELVQLRVDVLIIPPLKSDPCSQASDQDYSYCHGDDCRSSCNRINR
jgi:putative ABC transport system substrate-binding protein